MSACILNIHVYCLHVQAWQDAGFCLYVARVCLSGEETFVSGVSSLPGHLVLPASPVLSVFFRPFLFAFHVKSDVCHSLFLPCPVYLSLCLALTNSLLCMSHSMYICLSRSVCVSASVSRDGEV